MKPFNDLPNSEAQSLEALEAVIAEGLAKNQEGKLKAALALHQVHSGKRYRPQYRTFEEYLATRWQLTRARGYQLLHFARLSTMVDTNAPATERQARALDRHGKPRSQQEEEEDLTIVIRAMNNLVKQWERLSTIDGARDFIQSIRNLMSEMEENLNKLNPQQ